MKKQTGGFTKTNERDQSRRYYVESDYSDDHEAFFENNNDRRKFISKVYGILAISLACASAIVLFINLYEPATEFALEYRFLYIVFSVFFLVLYIIFVCCPSVGRISPINLIFFILMVACLGFSTAFFAAVFELRIIIYAFLLTVIITVVLTIIAIVIPVDFTKMGGACCVIMILQLVIVIVLTIVAVVTHIPWLHIVIAGVGVAVVSIFIVYDTQLIFGGKYGFEEDDYLTAAILLLFNVLALFQYLLIILAGVDD